MELLLGERDRGCTRLARLHKTYHVRFITASHKDLVLSCPQHLANCFPYPRTSTSNNRGPLRSHCSELYDILEKV